MIKSGFTSILIALTVLTGLVSCGRSSSADSGTAAPESSPSAPARLPSSNSDALADAEYVIRVALNAPEYLDTPIVQWEQEYAMANLFKRVIEARAGGRVRVEVYANGQLGDHKAVCEMVQSGVLEAAIGTGTMGQFYPPFEVLYIPYLFKSEEIAWDVLDHSQWWADFKSGFERSTGMALLALGQNGTRHFTHTKKQIQSPEDLKGEKIRVMTSPIFVEMMKAFGADAVPIAWSELYTSLQTGVVDGQENPISVIAANAMWEVQNYITLDGHLWSEDYLIMNADFLNALPADIRQIIRAAARQSEVVSRAVETIHSQGVGLATLEANGMSVYVPSVEEKQAYADISQPPVIAYLRESIDNSVIDGLLAAVEESERRFGYR